MPLFSKSHGRLDVRNPYAQIHLFFLTELSMGFTKREAIEAIRAITLKGTERGALFATVQSIDDSVFVSSYASLAEDGEEAIVEMIRILKEGKSLAS